MASPDRRSDEVGGDIDQGNDANHGQDQHLEVLGSDDRERKCTETPDPAGNEHGESEAAHGSHPSVADGAVEQDHRCQQSEGNRDRNNTPHHGPESGSDDANESEDRHRLVPAVHQRAVELPGRDDEGSQRQHRDGRSPQEREQERGNKRKTGSDAKQEVRRLPRRSRHRCLAFAGRDHIVKPDHTRLQAWYRCGDGDLLRIFRVGRSIAAARSWCSRVAFCRY